MIAKAVRVIVLLAMVTGVTCGRAPDVTILVDLTERLDLAKTRQEVAVLDLGTPDARLLLGDGWDATDGRWLKRVPFVWGIGDRSSVILPAFSRETKALSFRCRASPPADGSNQRMVVELNGMYLGRFELSRGWRTYHVDIPARGLRFGDNVVTFRYEVGWQELGQGELNARRLAVAWDKIWIRETASASAPEAPSRTGSPATSAPPEPTGTSNRSGSPTFGAARPPGIDAPARAMGIDRDGSGLRIPYRHEVSFYEEIPTDPQVGRRRIALAVDGLRAWDDELSGPGGRLLVRIRAPGSAAAVKAELRPGSGPWSMEIPDLDVDLPVVEISLASLGDELTGDGGLTVVRPRVIGTRGDEGPNADRDRGTPTRDSRREVSPVPERFPQANVIVYLIDTLRADHLGVYGYDRGTSPRIDAVAADGVVFDLALAQSSWTRPSVASIFTGLDPMAHGTNGRDDSLDRDAESIAKLFRGGGRQTAAFVTNGNVAPTFGFDEGFEHFEFLKERRTRQIHQSSDEVNRRLFPWLRAAASTRPFFLYVHTTDPHAPYTPPAPYRRRFAPEIRHPDLIMPLQLFRRPDRLDGVDLEAVRDDFVALYDAEIAFNDHNFGVLIDELRRLGLYDDTLIVVLSDHGEEFMDHGGWAHGKTLYGEQLRVPLIVKFPDDWMAGARVSRIARHVDVLPTLLDAVDLAVPRGIDGATLMTELAHRARRAEGEGGDPRDGRPGMTEQKARPPAGGAGLASPRSFAYLDLDGRLFHSLTTPSHHLIVGRVTPHRGGQAELYDIGSDPGQQRNLARLEPVRTGYLVGLLKRWRFTAETRLSPLQVEVDEELRERLRALGYIQ